MDATYLLTGCLVNDRFNIGCRFIVQVPPSLRATVFLIQTKERFARITAFLSGGPIFSATAHFSIWRRCGLGASRARFGCPEERYVYCYDDSRGTDCGRHEDDSLILTGIFSDIVVVVLF